jgi:hypothetical protein
VVVMRRIEDTRRWPILALIPCWKIKGRQKTKKGRRRRGEHKASKGLHLAADLFSNNVALLPCV